MKIRLASTSDYEAVCALIRSPEELFLVYPVGQYPLTVKQLQELSKWRIEMMVAEAEGRIVGFANLYNHEPKRHAFIGNVVVDARLRGNGYGREIIEHMIQQAREKFGLPEVRISVFNANTPALLLYSSLGFVPYGMEKRTSPEGDKLALLHMKKALLDG